MNVLKNDAFFQALTDNYELVEVHTWCQCYKLFLTSLKQQLSKLECLLLTNLFWTG
jgi:hypothetical protein